MSDSLIGVAAAIGSAALYAVGIALQALDARQQPIERALRLSLFRALVRRPRWVAGTAAGLAGWGLQALALTYAPLTLVQPLLTVSLVFLIAIAVVWLGERLVRRDLLAIAAIVAATPLLALTAPDRVSHHAGGAALSITLVALGLIALAPLTLRGACRSAPVSHTPAMGSRRSSPPTSSCITRGWP
jgi:drug/metabolite transporter (DMT)-like permease